ncbi:bacillithiol biosynthesis cysteine-adding enzyme BshC [Fulvivirga sp.]|uniref:bacillithiol biosynthesis cysteine-adding enzyme BshC n=2 Tax=Fulvivirga sp. TaxID=1931237 RepID=UPI0032ED4634
MKLASLDLEVTNKFSKLFIDYIQENDSLKDYYNVFPHVENFEQLIKERKFSAENRKILCQTLDKQYTNISKSTSLELSLTQLAMPNTFTITTGHQLNIFTGPLYFIYKIITVINTSKVLKEKYPDYNFVPVYWMASEDHDYDEIKYFRLDGKKHVWETGQNGAVGRFDTKELSKLAQEIPGIPDFFKTAYKQGKNLAEAVQLYVNELFGDEGLVVVDADDTDLKRLFATVIEDDIFNHSAKKVVGDCTDKLEAIGYKTQVFPREINFFYLDDQLRSRIEYHDGLYKVLDTDISFDRETLEKLIQEEPERFSPNVILRPVYQEAILPNLAYVGGPSEVAYWFQLKPIFDHYKIPFPALMPRNFAMIVPKHVSNKIEKTGLSWEEMFKDKNEIFKHIAIENTDNKVLLNGQMNELVDLFEKIKAQAESIDPTLKAHVEAQSVRTQHKLEVIEKKFIRAEKRKHSDKINQIESVLSYLFPNGGLQERTDNFLNFYLANPQFVKNLTDQLDPFDYRFHIFDNGQ